MLIIMKHTHVARLRMLAAAMVVMAAMASLSGALSAEEAPRLILGLGGMYTPEYPGSDEYEWGLCPFIKADWARGNIRLYAEGTEAGVRLLGIAPVPLSVYGGVSMGESRDDFSNPVRAFAGLSYGTDSLSLSTRIVYAPFWENERFGGHAFLPELYLTARAVRLPLVISGTLSLMAMDSTWADGYFASDSGFLRSTLGGNALMFFCRYAGVFVGADVARYLGGAEESVITENEWEASLRLGAFVMLGGKS